MSSSLIFFSNKVSSDAILSTSKTGKNLGKVKIKSVKICKSIKNIEIGYVLFNKRAAVFY